MGPKPVIKATYNLSIFPALEFKKDMKKRKGSNMYFKLDDDEPYNTWKAQLLVKINEKMSLTMLSFDNYDVSFTIPHVSPSPLAIVLGDDSNLLLEHVRKAKNTEATVVVQETPLTHTKEENSDSSSGDSDSDNGDHCKKKKKKKTQGGTRAPKVADIDESDQPMNKNIRALRDCWVCHKKPGCGSKYCNVNAADSGQHIPLTFPRLDCWAAAMLKGTATATLEMPLNHQHFKMIPDELLGQGSILTEHCQQLQADKAAKAAQGLGAQAAPLTPIINFNFPPELFQMLEARSHHTQLLLPAAPLATPNPVPEPRPVPAAPANMLFSPRQLKHIGQCMSIQEFSLVYNLSDELEAKLIKQGYTLTHVLCFSTLDDLKVVELLRGELAQLCDVISRWCDNHDDDEPE
ncbi:hypothetical protein BDN67DRAFT_1015519 [Paxillus ammoniavirescens]|nr:hypothetical protein BDN67DRAFT_1015519 [Paxillus ammoniavirescens]